MKNAEGIDSSRTAREDQLRQVARWLKHVGAAVATDATGLPGIALEVSPLFGDDETSFAGSWARCSPAPAIRDGLYLE